MTKRAVVDERCPHCGGIHYGQKFDDCPYTPLLTRHNVDCLVGRVLRRDADGKMYTVTSASTHGEVCVWDPRAQTLLRFDTQKTFENWAFGTSVRSGT